MRWLLDANVLIIAEGAGSDFAADFARWASGEGCAVTGAVRDELDRHSTLARTHALRQLAVHELPLLGPEAGELRRLRAGRTNQTEDLGEHESIAWLVHHEEWGFVTNEKGAAWLGLRSVQAGRIAAMERWLHDSSLARPVVDALLAENRRRYKALLPPAWSL